MSKYGNKATFFQGAKYDSRLEADYALRLEARLRAGELTRIQRQVPFILYGRNNTPVCTYKADFVVTTREGIRQVHEAKGVNTAVWQLKKKLFLDCYPDIPLYINGVRVLPKRARKKAS